MKIGFDAKRAFLNHTGLGNYSRNVIRAMLKHYPQHEYYLFTPSIVANDFYEEIKNLPNVQIIQPKRKIFLSLWRSYSITPLINKYKLDVYHGLSNELPLNIKKSKVKKVVTIHDLIPFKEDTFRNIFDDYFAKKKMFTACRDANIITPISIATSEDIYKLFGTDKSKLKVVYQPIVLNEPKTLPEVKQKYQLPEKFILQVGRVEYRKNVQVILRALILLKNPDLHYVLVGRKTRFYKSLLAFGINFGLKPNLHFIDRLNDDELAAVYRLSSAVVYPSLYEGFGLPIAEAIYFGKAVLTTQGGCFEEAGGPGAYYCNTSDPNEVATTISKMLKTDNSAMMEAGQRHIRQFNSEATAAALMEIYSK
jgi:glycosyltransferase involved in cell wall biosynthesis